MTVILLIGCHLLLQIIGSSYTLSTNCEESNFVKILSKIESQQSPYIITTGCVLSNETLIVHNKTGVSLVGDGEEGNAIVTCNFETTFIFNDTVNISISGITFVNCGGIVPHNYSKYYYNHIKIAVFLFHNCESVKITHVTVEKYNGTAFVFSNVHRKLLIEHVNITRNGNVSWPNGGGIQLDFFGDYHDPTNATVTLSFILLLNSIQNCDDYKAGNYDDKDCHEHKHYMSPSWNAQGLTINFRQINSHVTVHLVDSLIANNTGCNCSGVFVAFEHAMNHSHFEIERCNLTNNSISMTSKTAGSSLLVFLVKRNSNTYESQITTIDDSDDGNKSITPIILRDSQITHHSFRTPIHILNMRNVGKYKTLISLINVVFQDNSVKDQAICMSVVSLYDSQTDNANIQVDMTNTIASKNSQINSLHTNNLNNQAIIPPVSAALFLFINLDTVNINNSFENALFSFNNASVFLGIATDFYLTGKLLFMSNTALVGACFQLHSFSHIFLAEGANISFTNNHALSVGGAIASYSEGNEFSMCFLQVTESYNMSTSNISVYFMNNSAQFAGDDIYGDQIYNCFISSQCSKIPKDLYNKTIKTYNIKKIVSKPFFVRYSRKKSDSLKFYPGGVISLCLKVVDKNDNSVPAYIFSSFSNDNTMNLRLNSSTLIYNNVKSTDCGQTFYIRVNASSIIIKQIDLFLSTPYGTEYETVKLKMKQCPSGFYLHKEQQKCVCHKCLNKIAVGTSACDIDGIESERIKTWVHCYDTSLNDSNDGTTCKYSEICQKGYCSDTMLIKDINKPKKLCAGRRTNVVCGSCMGGYSVQMGSRKCAKCKNIYILLVPGFVLFGILLVFAIYLLNLTIDHGTIGGVIFYANVIHLVIVLPPVKGTLAKTLTEVLYWFVTSINFELGSPVCFYHGMTDLHKQFIQFLFPLYMCLIVLSIVVISRRSIRLSNLTSHLSVQVLVTILHLTFARFLLSIIESFAFMQLHETNFNSSGQETNPSKISYVWLLSGDVHYGQHGHLALLIIAGILLLTVLLPYLALSIVAPFLYSNRWINRFKPAFDTMYAPYKDKYRHWFGYRLFTVWLVSITYAVTIGLNDHMTNHVRTTILLAYTFSLMLQQPFKSIIINYLEIWLSANVTLCGILEMHEYKDSTIYYSKIALIFMAFVTSCIVLLYHLILALKRLPCLNKITSKTRKFRFNSINDETEPTLRALSTGGGRYSDYGSSTISRNNQLRESLLSTVSHQEDN